MRSIRTRLAIYCAGLLFTIITAGCATGPGWSDSPYDYGWGYPSYGYYSPAYGGYYDYPLSGQQSPNRYWHYRDNQENLAQQYWKNQMTFNRQYQKNLQTYMRTYPGAPLPR